MKIIVDISTFGERDEVIERERGGGFKEEGQHE